MMAYVGSEGSCSGFHRCFSSTVALNFLIDTEGERSQCTVLSTDDGLTQP